MICYGGDDDEVFIGTGPGPHPMLRRGNRLHLIDEEVKRIIDESYANAKKMHSEEHMDVLHSCAALLVEKEKIGREEFKAFSQMKMRKLPLLPPVPFVENA